ncbi:MAG: OmpA family protein [Thermodesulfobacteriota bacterium]|nr:OmpA family protein [Thermodesulfobacteriota bacterium]
MKRIASAIVILSFALTLVSCAGASKEQKGTAIGAGVGAGLGAILGQAIGGDTEGTLIGAGIGALVGGIAGNQVGVYMDRQERDLREALAASEAASVQRTKEATAASEAAGTQRFQDVLTATFRSEVLFDFDSATLKPGAYAELARVAVVLQKYPQTSIRVEGHTDSKGSESYNQELSERRAEAVKNALIQQDVDPSRIEALGHGETQPISSDATMNRRVTIVIKPIVQTLG